MPKFVTEHELVTVEDFYCLVPDSQKADLIEGVIYMASPDTLRNDQIARFLGFLMDGYAESKRLGTVLGSRFAFTLTKFNAPEPDIAFVSKRRSHLLWDRGMKGGPDIAVEIVSRDSRHRDYFDKKILYEEAGVPEYWIIDPLKNRAEFYLLKNKRYGLAPLERNRIFRSKALKGFWLDVEWLFAWPLPAAIKKFQAIIKP